MIESVIQKLKHNTLARRLVNKYPNLAMTVVFKPLSRFMRYKDERKLEKGKHVSENTKKSVVLFTAHKCASTLVNPIIAELAADADMTHIDFESYFTGFDAKKYDQFDDPSFLNKAYRPTGYYFGAYRRYRAIPNLEQYKTVLVLRDPRDVVTSHYFSMAYSHLVVNDNVKKARDRAKNQTVDEYVLENAGRFQKIYQSYCDHVLGKPNVLFLRYEEMIVEFDPWLKKLAAHLELNQNSALIQKFIDQTSFKAKKEDVHSHIRSIKARDFADKLKPETIDFVNETFKDILEKMNYEI